MYKIIAYIVGNVKYKRVSLNSYEKREDVVREYRGLLDSYASNPEFIGALLDDNNNILTCWALQTPIQLKEAADMALDRFESGEDLYVDPNLKMVNLFGSQIYDELVEEGKKIGVL